MGFELGRLTCRNPDRMETLNFEVFVFVLNPLQSKSSQEEVVVVMKRADTRGGLFYYNAFFVIKARQAIIAN